VIGIAGLGGALLALPAAAQTPSPSPTPPPTGPVLQRPSPPPVESTAKTAALPGAPRSRSRSSVDAGVLKDVRLLSFADGQARIREASGVERTLRPGDAIGGDVVKAIGDGRIVLVRPQSDAMVVVSFDASGRPRVRVIWKADRGAGREPVP
jgi:hypothetical protein